VDYGPLLGSRYCVSPVTTIVYTPISTLLEVSMVNSRVLALKVNQVGSGAPFSAKAVYYSTPQILDAIDIVQPLTLND
jgi:hypothetical protein